jgi:hypothetical protein
MLILGEAKLNLNNTKIVLDGNSLTWGHPTGPASAFSPGVQLDTLLTARGITPRGGAAANIAVSGQNTVQMAGLGSAGWPFGGAGLTTDISAAYDVGAVANVLFMWEVTNDICRQSGATPSPDAAAAWQNVLDYISVVRAFASQTWRVILVSPIPRAGTAPVDRDLGWADVQMLGVTELMRANWRSVAEGFIDLRSEYPEFATIGGIDNSGSGFYDADAVHLTTAGATAVAGSYLRKLLTQRA